MRASPDHLGSSLKGERAHGRLEKPADVDKDVKAWLKAWAKKPEVETARSPGRVQ